MTSPLVPGDSAPWFTGPVIAGNSAFVFDTMGGRPIVMLLFGNSRWPGVAQALRLMADNRALFDDVQASFFGVTIEPADVESGQFKDEVGCRFFADLDRAISKAYRATSEDAYFPHWVLIDRTLRVVETAALDRGEDIIAAVQRLNAVENDGAFAPVLTVPRVFEPGFCRQLIAYYEAQGGVESGFVQDQEGVTIFSTDDSHKRRADCIIREEPLRKAVNARINRLLLPAIHRAFQFNATRIERYIVACYNGDDRGGHFKAHRDNTTAGTAHRRFACTINLNTEEYEGGELSFPEFGNRSYRAPTGGAIIFSCSLLHEARPVTGGKRYAFLPFFYDDAAADLRERNRVYLQPDSTRQTSTAA